MLNKFDITIVPLYSDSNIYDLKIFSLNMSATSYKYISNHIFTYRDENSKIIGIEIEDVLDFKDYDLIPQEFKSCWDWIQKTNYIQKQLIFK